MEETPKTQLVSGEQVPADHSHTELKSNGQQKDYVVLTPEERAKGYVRPVRDSYIHVGRKPRGVIEMLDEPNKLNGKTYVAIDRFELVNGTKAGTYLTQQEVDQINETGRYGGCGTLTKMSMPIAETYARDPKFYTGTFCIGCSQHLPLDHFVWSGTDTQVGT